MGQLERYGLYVLCVVIFLILGVALWGGDPAVAANKESVASALARDLRSSTPLKTAPAAGPEVKDSAALKDDAVSRLRRAFATSSENDPAKPGPAANEPLAGVTTAPRLDAGKGTVPLVAPATTTEYVVKKGDNLEAIALQFLGKRSAWHDIVKANPGLTPTKMMTGDRIKLPSKTTAAPVAPAHAQANEYEIRKDDNLEGIALSKLGKRSLWREIVAVNPGLNPSRLQPGTKIKLPAVAKAGN